MFIIFNHIFFITINKNIFYNSIIIKTQFLKFILNNLNFNFKIKNYYFNNSLILFILNLAFFQKIFKSYL